MQPGEFPGSPVVRAWLFHCWAVSSIPGGRTKILHAAQLGQKERKKKNSALRAVFCGDTGLCTDWTPLRPRYKLLSFWQEGVQRQDVIEVNEIEGNHC